MKPKFKITADGADVTARIADRLERLELVDEDGTKSDRLTLSVDDRDGLVAFPDMNAKIEVWLGFEATGLSYMGAFAVDQVGGQGPLQIIEIGCKPVDMKSDVRAPKTRAWEDMSLSDIVKKIAGEAGLKPIVSASIAAAHWSYLAQTTESNLHFLTRIAATLDATAKPAGASLVVQKRGEGLTAAGDALTPPVIDRKDMSDWRWSLDGREIYRRAEAEWCEPGAAKRHLITRGSGEPCRRLRHPFSSAEEASRACEAALSKSDRSGMKISVSVAGFRPSIMAGTKVTLSGLRPELNGEWHVKSATHSLTTALRTTFEATKGADV